MWKAIPFSNDYYGCWSTPLPLVSIFFQISDIEYNILQLKVRSQDKGSLIHISAQTYHSILQEQWMYQ